MPYLRLTADRRGFEHTFLLHVAAPGERPKVLYWYRTAPGLQIGRPALDDSSMRALEAQYPEIDFDWPYLLELASMTPVEVEAPVPQRKRKPRRPDTDDDEDGAAVAATPVAAPVSASAPRDEPAPPAPAPLASLAPENAGADLLSDLLGRGIAASLRDRHRELEARIGQAPVADDVRRGWRARLAAVDPDAWTTPEAVLQGMALVDGEVEALRRQLDAAKPPVAEG